MRVAATVNKDLFYLMATAAYKFWFFVTTTSKAGCVAQLHGGAGHLVTDFFVLEQVIDPL